MRKTGNAAKPAETVTIPRAEYENLKAQNQWLLEQLRVIHSKQFGASSEKASEEVYEQLSLLFNEAEVYADEAEEAPAVEARSHTRQRNSGSARDILPENVEVVEVEHTLPEEERLCPQCGEVMKSIGTQVQEKIEIIPAKVILHRDIYTTYACANCKENDIATPIVQTPKAPALIPGSYASAEAVAHIAVQKFVMGSPLYRQEQEWNRQGVMLSRQTMSNWLLRSTEHWLAPVYDALHRQLLQNDLLHADETELQVLHEEGRAAQARSYMWLYRTSGDAGHPIVLYEYCPGRGQEYPNAFLSGFRGVLQTDGYAGYNGLEDVTHAGCWAHVRRKFEEALKAVPKGKRSPTAEQGVAYCTRLFQIEEKLKDSSPEERKKQRQEQEKPVLDAVLAWANTRTAAPKSKLGIALNYLKNQWPTLLTYLEDGRIELSNNRAERSIKPFVIARKNFLFANTPKGARCSAMLFSLIETAKENGLDPYRYLSWVLNEAPRRAERDPGWLLPSSRWPLRRSAKRIQTDFISSLGACHGGLLLCARFTLTEFVHKLAIAGEGFCEDIRPVRKVQTEQSRGRKGASVRIDARVLSPPALRLIRLPCFHRPPGLWRAMRWLLRFIAHIPISTPGFHVD